MFKNFGLPIPMLATLGLLVVNADAFPRLVDNWPYERLFEQSDVVIISTASLTKETTDRFVDERWPLEFVGQDTTFQVLHVLKGKLQQKEIHLLHYQFGKLHDKAKATNGIVEIIDGPSFLSFADKPLTVDVGGVALMDHKLEYLIFLKKREDGRYEPVTGQIDPKLSVRELLPSVFSRGK